MSQTSKAINRKQISECLELGTEGRLEEMKSDHCSTQMGFSLGHQNILKPVVVITVIKFFDLKKRGGEEEHMHL